MLRNLCARNLRRIPNLWPPFLFMGIRVRAIGEDFRSAEVELRVRPWNRNYVGTRFGGSLRYLCEAGDDRAVLDAVGAPRAGR